MNIRCEDKTDLVSLLRTVAIIFRIKTTLGLLLAVAQKNSERTAAAFN